MKMRFQIVTGAALREHPLVVDGEESSMLEGNAEAPFYVPCKKHGHDIQSKDCTTFEIEKMVLQHIHTKKTSPMQIRRLRIRNAAGRNSYVEIVKAHTRSRRAAPRNLYQNFREI